MTRTTFRVMAIALLLFAAQGLQASLVRGEDVPLNVSPGGAPTDPQIAHIAYTAGQIDIEAARLALKKSKNKNVRSFAEDMVRDHVAVNDKALALPPRAYS